MACIICKTDTYPSSEILGEEGMCVPCGAQYSYELFEKTVELELKQYKRRTGGDINEYNEFYQEAYEGKVDINQLSCLNNLKECYEMAIEDKRIDQLPPDPQLQINFDNDLPF